MSTTRIERECAACSAHLAELTAAHHGGAPEPGDICVCRECGAALVFDHSVRMRILTLAELANLEPAVRDAVTRTQANRKESGARAKLLAFVRRFMAAAI